MWGREDKLVRVNSPPGGWRGNIRLCCETSELLGSIYLILACVKDAIGFARLLEYGRQEAVPQGSGFSSKRD